MIFVTVGTHEQPFNRLVEYVDQLKKEKIIEEEVFIQSGYTTYEPKYCKFSKLIPYSDMQKYIQKARIVITHGGPASFIMPLQVGKVPVVVPRQKKYGEHVNDHQLEFAQEVEKRKKNIILIDNIEKLKDIIINYDDIVSNLSCGIDGNNEQFNKKLSEIVDEMFQKRGTAR